MASINGFQLRNIGVEEYIDDTEFIFGELFLKEPLGEFTRRRKMPKYARYSQYIPEYMYLSIANTTFRWYNDIDVREITKLFNFIVRDMNPKSGILICRFIDCLFHLENIQKTWFENGQMPIQCVWNNKAYRIYGLDGTEPFGPFDETMQKIAKGFAHDFGLANVSWFENEDDFDLSISDEQVASEENIQFIC